MPNLQLSHIFLYPVKSLAGISVEQWSVNHTGLLYDRHWMLVDQDNAFLSQRRLPRMALIHTALTESSLIISAPGMTDLVIGLTEWCGETLSVQIWHDVCVAHVVSSKADQWFSDFLNCSCRFVYQPATEIRVVDPSYANVTDQTSFSDGFPFLIISENSLTALNAQLSVELSIERFRPNLVISGCPAHAEDRWREISINNIQFRLPKPCSRCVVPGIDPITAEITKEPLQTLAHFRKWQNKIYFGQNALHNSIGRLHKGAEVTVLSTGPLQPPL